MRRLGPGRERAGGRERAASTFKRATSAISATCSGDSSAAITPPARPARRRLGDGAAPRVSRRRRRVSRRPSACRPTRRATPAREPGAAPGSEFVTCERCQGRGVINDDQGPFAMSSVCPVCQGRGGHFAQACPTCHGTGREPSSRARERAHPARRGRRPAHPPEGQGQPGRERRTARRPLRRRARRRATHASTAGRATSRRRCSVPLTQAMLGTTVEVPTLDDPVTLKVPAGTQPGTTMRVRGRGVPANGKTRRGRPARHRQRHGAQEADQAAAHARRAAGDVR